MRLKSRRNNSQVNKQNHSNVFRFKKDIETVLKLNFSPYNESQSFNQTNKNNNSLSQTKFISSNKNNDISINSDNSENSNNNPNNIDSKYEKNLNKFTNSLKKLQKYYPNNTDLIELEKTSGVKIPTRIEHIKIENRLKEQISSYEQEENKIKEQKDIIEKELFDTENKILDLQLNIEVVMGVEKENNNKVIRDKLISKFEKEYNKKENDNNKNKKKSYTNSKEFQDELDLFMKREEYNTKLKAKEIENDIINYKNKKKEINERLNIVLENLKNVHKNKNFYLDKLYTHYLNLLHDGKDTRNEGLCWIIREIFALDKKVMLSYMPPFLDKLCVKYLFTMTHLNIEITDVENEIKSCKEEFKKAAIINNGNDFLIRRNIINNNHNIKNHQSNKYLNEKNKIMNEYLDKIRKTFCISLNYNRNNNFKNSQSYIKKNKNLVNKHNDLLNKQFKKEKTTFILPFLNGDPNSMINSKNDITNKLIKEELNTSIPDILRVKDLEKWTKNNGYFLSAEEVKKVKNYLNLNKKLNNLRKKKENMKTDEMTRIFKEFQKNDYEIKFNIDKVSVISALIGEDNLNSEMVKQSKRERKYIEEILKGRMHKKIMGTEKSNSVKNLYGSTQYNSINKRFKILPGIENIKNSEDMDRRFNSLGNTNY